MSIKTVNISNISCQHCTNTIENELSELQGVINVKADAETKMVTIEWNESAVDWNQIAELLNEIGFPVGILQK
jgi:copper chaperone CopZ